MSGIRRLALFAVLLAPLVLAAVLLASRREEGEVARAPGSTARPDERASSAPELWGRTAQRVVRAENRHEAEAARREDPHGEPGPMPRALRLYERTRAEAEPLGRRFFVAFSRYELGRLSGALARELRASATPGFARELLAAPSRVPPGIVRPERAFLGRLEFVPGEPNDADTELVTGELVGLARRGADNETIAIELRRGANGWRVSGLGR